MVLWRLEDFICKYLGQERSKVIVVLSFVSIMIFKFNKNQVRVDFTANNKSKELYSFRFVLAGHENIL